MSDSLDDFNQRMTTGNSPLATPPANAAETIAQSFIDARLPHPIPVDGGSIDFGRRPSAILLLIGIVLFAAGSYGLDHLKEGAAIGAIALLILSGFLLLIGGGGLAIATIKNLAGRQGRRHTVIAVAIGLGTWWLLPAYAPLSLFLPNALTALGLFAAVMLARKPSP